MAGTSSDTLLANVSNNITFEASDGDVSNKQKGIPLPRKICYAVGGAPYQMTANAKGFFMQIFLLDVVQMGAFYVSLILFLGRAGPNCF